MQQHSKCWTPIYNIFRSDGDLPNQEDLRKDVPTTIIGVSVGEGEPTDSLKNLVSNPETILVTDDTPNPDELYNKLCEEVKAQQGETTKQPLTTTTTTSPAETTTQAETTTAEASTSAPRTTPEPETTVSTTPAATTTTKKICETEMNVDAVFVVPENDQV